jgi:hypothetical protein
MRIDSSGNVGIGTSLTPIGSSASSRFITVAGSGDGVLQLTKTGSGGGAIASAAGTGMLFYTHTGTVGSESYTERMRIDSSGRVLLGTTTAGESSADDLTIATTGQTGITLRSGTANAGAIYFADGTSGTAQYSGYIYYGHSNNVLGFATNAAERMRIDSSGNLLVGKTATSSTVAGIVLGSNDKITATRNGGPCAAFVRTGSDGSVIDIQNDGSTVGSISVSGSSTSFNTSSDYRLKTDAQPMTGASARVQALNPVNFEWIADGTRVDGFLAHEAQAVVPEAVTGTKDAMRDEEYEVTPAVEATYDDEGNELTAAVDAVMGTRSVPDYQGIDQSKLVPLLTAALQEALTKIDNLETRLSALEG